MIASFGSTCNPSSQSYSCRPAVRLLRGPSDNQIDAAFLCLPRDMPEEAEHCERTNLMFATFRMVTSVAFLVGIAMSADAAITEGGYSVVVSKTTRDGPTMANCR